MSHVSFSRMDRIRQQAAAFILGAVVLFYDIGVGGEVTIIPLYIPVIIFSLLFLRFDVKDVYFLSALIVLFFSVSLLQRAVLPAPGNLIRTTGGIVLIISLSFAIKKLWDISAEQQHRHTISVLKVLFWMQIAMQVAQIFYSKITGHTLQNGIMPAMPRVSGFAGEASHVAMILSPYIFMSVISPRQFRRAFGPFSNMALALSVLWVGYSATGYVIYFGAYLCRLISRRSLIKLFVMGPVFFGTGLLLPPVQERLYGVLMAMAADVNGSDNLSVLVLLKGAEMALGALMHHPLGAGMLNFSSLLEYSDIASFGRGLDTLNNHDGSSLLFKGIGEFGYFFLAFYIYHVIRFLRDLWTPCTVRFDFLRMSLIFSFLIAAVRGGGYFDGPQLLGIVLALTALLEHRYFDLRWGRRRSAAATVGAE